MFHTVTKHVPNSQEPGRSVVPLARHPSLTIALAGT